MAIKKIYDLSVDLKRTRIKANVPVLVQGDTTEFRLRLLDDGKELDSGQINGITGVELLSGFDAQTIVRTTGTMDGSTAVFTIEQGALYKSGQVKAMVRLTDSTDRISTLNFDFKVIPDPTANYVPGEQDVTIFQQYIQDAQEKIDVMAATDVQVLSQQLAETGDNLNSRGISILDFESYKSGNDWTPAFNAALSFLANSTTIKKLSIPARTFTILTQINITSAHNGITIEGEGYSTEIKVMDGATQNYAFHVYDANNGIEGITLRNFRANGNKANIANQSATGFGVFIRQGTTSKNEHILIESIWTHDFLTSGVNVFSDSLTLNNVFSWGNKLHGVGTAQCESVNMSNITCHHNGGYGIDISGGEVVLTNFNCSYNTLGGMKTSLQSPAVSLKAINGKLNWNDGYGFYTTQSAGGTFMFDNIEANDNGLDGFAINEGKYCTIGKIIVLRNFRLGSNPVAGVSLKIDAQVDTIITEFNKGYGLYVAAPFKHVHIKRLISRENGNIGAFFTDDSKVTIDSGEILNNCNDTGNYSILMGRRVAQTLNEITFGDNREIKKQINGIQFNIDASARLTNSDLELVTGIKINDAGKNLFLKNNKGYVTERNGKATFSGNGTTTNFIIPHNLTLTPTYANVTAGSVSARGDFSISVGTTSISIVYATAPPAGTDNVVLFWAAEYNKVVT